MEAGITDHVWTIYDLISSAMLEWKPYDPTWLVEAVSRCCPDRAWLRDALSKCTMAGQKSKAYIYFVDASNPNKPGSQWQFEENIVVDDPIHGELVLDILKGRRVGGVEIIKEIEL
jgi:hypothetical protein